MTKARNRILIRNIYHLMAYAYSSLELDEFRHVESEDFTQAVDLLADILLTGASVQIKRGLEKGYIETEETLTTIRSKIDLQRMANPRLSLSGKIHCRFSEYTEDVFLNRIIKSTLLYLLRTKQLPLSITSNIKKTLVLFDRVSEIPLGSVRWGELPYHRNNASYRFLINVCYMIYHDLLPTEFDGDVAIEHVVSPEKLNLLYEHFLLEYFRRHHPELKPSARRLDGVEGARPSLLPYLITDITLESNEKVLVIDAKCYGHIFNQHFDKQIISAANYHQIYHYASIAKQEQRKPTAGLLLYAKTIDEEIDEMVWRESDITFEVRTLNLDDDFRLIAQSLEDIVSCYL